MDQARRAFENFMASRGRDVSDLWNGKRYTNVNMNTKWSYFLLGWTMNQGK
jgi:hypothetical protein